MTRVLIVCAVNVVAMLHNFWEQRQMSQSNSSSGESDGSVGDAAIQTESLLLYESAPSPGPPYVCYVTLPGGSCFGNYKVCLASSIINLYITVNPTCLHRVIETMIFYIKMDMSSHFNQTEAKSKCF